VNEQATASSQEYEERDGIDAAQEHMDQGTLGPLASPRTVLFIFLGIVVAIVGLYLLLPKLVGVSSAFSQIGDATWYWVVVAVGFVIVAFVAYAAAFKSVVGGGADSGIPPGRLNLRASYEITMAGFAGSTFFSAAGAGGLIIIYWALRKAGMEARRAACRMVALLVLLYSFYALALIVFGVLLRTGVLHGSHPAGGTIIPASVAGVAFLLLGLLALVPADVERQLSGFEAGKGRAARIARRVATVPGTVAAGVRTAYERLRERETATLAVLGGLLYWGGNIGVLWAAFHAYGVEVPFGVVVQAFFVGMAANVIPSPAAGAGPVDAGMIAAFLLFDIPKESVFPAVLTYRLIAFWLPTIPGIIAYFQLRRTVQGWEELDTRGYTSVSKVLEAKAT
jgi:putative heme transporter